MTETALAFRLLGVIVCPLTRTPLRFDAGRALLISDTAGLSYPVRQGVPILITEEARPWPPSGYLPA